MDPVTMGAVLAAVAGGAGGAMGSQVWDGVSALVRRPLRRSSEAGANATASASGQAELAALAQAPGDRQRATALATVLVTRADSDSGFAEALQSWCKQARQVDVSGDVTNTVSGGRHGQFRDAVIGLLVREVLLSPSEPGTQFADDIVDDVRQLQQQAENRPGSTIRLASDDDDSLRAALDSTQPDPVSYKALLAQSQEGRTSLADIARFAVRPYAAVLLHRPGGLVAAFDLGPGLRQAGEDAAKQAVQGRACVADLSALYLLGLISEDDRLRVRAAVHKMITSHASVGDATLTRDQMRGLAIATYTAALRADGTVERTTLTPTEQAKLRERAESLETLAASLETRSPTNHVDAAADTIAVAKEGGLALWCDDIALRQRARQAGVPAFSLLDLITYLHRQGSTIDQPSLYRRLATEYVTDLPLSGDDVVSVAAAEDWNRGPAHTALARQEWWRYHGDNWTDPWLTVATEARRHSAAALLEITRAALVGSVAYASPGQRTKHYQELVVLALVACHNIAEQPPDNLLADLAKDAAPGLAPSPKYVLKALIAELEKRSVPAALEVALRMLPGAELL